MPYKYMKLRNLLFRNSVERNYKHLTEEDFKKGLKFNVKYIGSLEISRPVSRIEIVAAMRRVRFEFRVKGIKKKKVALNVSVDGVQVHLVNKKRKQRDDKLISHYPISKIFYVSHDSQDLKIFSYITSNETSKIFRCNVFKSYKMAQAVQIVKTMGQAFDVCHRISVESNRQNSEPLFNVDSLAVVNGDEADDSVQIDESEQPLVKSSPNNNNNFRFNTPPSIGEYSSLLESTEKYKITSSATLPLDPRVYLHNNVTQTGHLSRLRQQLTEQKQQNDLILIQMDAIKNQLETEHASRITAEMQMQELIKENQNLLFRMYSMMGQLFIKSDNVNSRDNVSKNNQTDFSSKSDNLFGGEFYHRSPDSGHDDTISSTLSRFRDPVSTWSSSVCHLRIGDEGYSVVDDDKDKFGGGFGRALPVVSTPTPLSDSVLIGRVNEPKNLFSKHLPVVG